MFDELGVVLRVEAKVDVFPGHPGNVEVNDFVVVFDFDCVSEGDVVVGDSVVVEFHEGFGDIHDVPDLFFEV